MHPRFFFIAVVLTAHLVGAAVPAPTLGDRFQVNALNWTGDQSNPDVAMADDGGFLIAWEDADGNIYSRMWTAAGPIIPDGRLNTYTTGTQDTPSVAALSNGSFVVVWASSTCPLLSCTGQSIMGQVIGSTGLPLADDIVIQQVTTTLMFQPTVSPLGTGFVVAWASLDGPGNDTDVRIESRRFFSSGAANGSEIQLNLSTSGWQYQPALAEKPLFGGYYSAYVSDPSPFGDPTDDRSILERGTNSSGTPDGSEPIRVSNDQVSSPAVAFNRIDNHVVIWEQGNGIAATSFSRFGSGDTFLDVSGSGNGRPRVDAMSWDGYVFTHTNHGVIQWHLLEGASFNASWGVLSGVGAPIGGHGIAAAHWGGFISVWDQTLIPATVPGGYDTDRGIVAVIVTFDRIFTDGFESTDTAMWPSTAP